VALKKALKIRQVTKNPASVNQRGFFIALKEAAYLASLSSLAAAITSVEIFCGQGI
jgi:hypothetical protein